MYKDLGEIYETSRCVLHTTDFNSHSLTPLWLAFTLNYF